MIALKVNFLKYSSFHTVREKRNPSRTGIVDANERPDITTDIKGNTDQVLIDVTIPVPCKGTSRCIIPIPTTGEAALEKGRKQNRLTWKGCTNFIKI
jgi:hypothetical protein